MFNPTQIQKHMNVVSANNEPLGTVDHLVDSTLKLARDVVGQHHYVPLTWIAHVDSEVHLTRSAAEVERMWAGEKFE